MVKWPSCRYPLKSVHAVMLRGSRDKPRANGRRGVRNCTVTTQSRSSPRQYRVYRKRGRPRNSAYTGCFCCVRQVAAPSNFRGTGPIREKREILHRAKISRYTVGTRRRAIVLVSTESKVAEKIKCNSTSHSILTTYVW